MQSKLRSLTISSVIGLALLAGTGSAQAHVTYYDTNTADWVPSNPNYTGSLPVLWQAHIHNAAFPDGNLDYGSGGNRVTVAADDAYADNGINVNLSTAANSWNGGTGADLGLGLIKLTASGQHLKVDVGADASGLFPAFAVYQGWGTGYNASTAFVNAVNNPLGTTGLTYVGGAVSTSGTDAIWTSATTLNSGNYTVILGDNHGAGGAYMVTVAAVPEPETYAMMLVGFALVRWQVRRKFKASAV
jgi:hypothetical protein